MGAKVNHKLNLDGKQEARTPDKKVGQPGAPKKSVDEVADQHWSEFARADKHSLFFSEVSEVKRRLLIRWGQHSANTGTLGQGSREATLVGVVSEALPNHGGVHQNP